MDRICTFVLRHRRWVMAFWALLFVVGAAGSSKVTDRLSFDFSLPGQPGFEAQKTILQEYGGGGFNAPLIAVVTAPSGRVTDRADDVDRLVTGAVAASDAAEAATAKAAGTPPPRPLRVVDYVSSGKDPRFVTADGRSTYALVFPPEPQGFVPGPETSLEPALKKAAAGAGLQAQLTGYNLLAAGGDSTGPSLLAETLLGGLGALAVLAFVFASFLALVPLLIAAVSILTTFLVVLLLTTFTEVSFIVQFLVALIGLGVAIDYSLLVVTRWREERAHGRDNHEAVRLAVRHAGRAVVSSGVTVAVSLLALIVIPVPFLRSVGYGGMLIPLVSTIVTLTLLPALLGGIGPRVDFPHIRKESSASRAWTAWTRGVVRFRWVAAGLSLLVLVLLALPLFTLQIGTARTQALASGGPAYDALQVLERGGVGTGVTTPIEVLVRGGQADADRVAAAAKAVPGVSTAVAPATASWGAGGTRLVSVLPAQETVDSNSVKVVDRVKQSLAGDKAVVGVTGQGALVTDYIEAVYKKFPYVLLVVVLATFVLLAHTFRSLLLPLKAVILNLLSVSATFGAAVLFWQDGYGSSQVFGIESTGAITFWLPVMIFAFLFGLSMDYEVFILARVREEYDRDGSTDRAVVEGLGRTGRLVTSAALILFLAFVSLGAAPNTDIKVFATALGVGILLDATVVRALLVPALVSLFGRWNWWLPSWAAKVLRVAPSAPRPEVRVPLQAGSRDPVGTH